MNLVSVDRELGARGGLARFVKLAWKLVEPTQELVWNWHADLICEHLEACSRKEIRKLILNVPPGCMKSSLVSVFWPVWHWIADPDQFGGDPGARWFRGSYDGGLTLRDAGKAYDLMCSRWFRDRWGHMFTLTSGAAKGDYWNSRMGWAFAASMGGAVTGKHFDFHIVDDPHKPKDLTPVGLKAANAFMRTLTTRRRNPATLVQVLVMQRLHERDLAGEMIDEGGWEVLSLPMRFEEARRSVTSVGCDPRKEEGELLFPVRFPEEAVAEIEKGLGGRESQEAASQLQQRPTPESGLIFKAEWFKGYLSLPRFDRMLQSWDMTFKATKGTDSVCGQVWGIKGSDMYLVHQVLKRMTFTESVAAVQAVSRQFPRAHAKLIEDKANGPAVIDTLGKKLPGLIPITPEGGKVARANAVTVCFEAGNVWHPHPSIAPWVKAHQGSLLAFPAGRHDDDVDACTQALNYSLKKNRGFAAAMAAARKNPHFRGG